MDNYLYIYDKLVILVICDDAVPTAKSESMDSKATNLQLVPQYHR